MTTDEQMFFDSKQQMLPLYERLRDAILSAHPDVTIKVSRTQISFRSRYIFATASLPFRRIKDWPQEYLLVSFGLGYLNSSIRIANAAEVRHNRWTHHWIAEHCDDINDELLSLIEEAYQFSLVK